MKPYFEHNLVRIYNKDSRSMDELPDESVQCVVTSPPYWGLRKYADLPDLVWGSNQCEHEWQIIIKPKERGSYGESSWHRPGRDREAKWQKQESNWCSLCGAWKGSYGLEPTPELYIQHTIEILREIRRVLRKDGVVFWNIGDSYVSGKSRYSSKPHTISGGKDRGDNHHQKPDQYYHEFLKDKDLCLIPFRVAIACQEAGWWVRSVIIWSKPNPMPESVTDRPTESHEYILMLTKSGTTQYWTHRDGGGTRERPKADYRWVNKLTQEEVAVEPLSWKEKITCPECNGTGKEVAIWGDYKIEMGKCPNCGGKGKVKLWRRINLWRGHDYYWDQEAVREPYSPTERWGGDDYKGAVKGKGHTESAGLDRPRKVYQYKDDEAKTGGIPFFRGTPNYRDPRGRNIRTVWEFPTQPFPKAHFAVFPEKLPELCIKAATPEAGCCSKCGAPWERIKEPDIGGTIGHSWHPHIDDLGQGNVKHQTGKEYQTYKRGQTLGWHPTCSCNADKVPSIVLDPFLGTGTTLWVAKILGRRAVGYELSEAYCALSLERNRQMVMEL